MTRISLRLTLLSAVALVPALLGAQDAPKPTPVPVVSPPVSTLPLKRAPQPTKAAISVQDLMTRLYIFADDSMMGRDAGTKGNLMGTDYLASEVKRIGLVPMGENGTYFQTLPLKDRSFDPRSSLSAGGASLAYGKEWIALGRATLNMPDLDVVFGGMLGDTARLSAEQAAGKLVVIGVPLNNQAINRAIVGTGVVPAGAAAVMLVMPPTVLPAIQNAMSTQLKMFTDDGSTETRIFLAATAVNKVFVKPLDSLTLGESGAKVQLNSVITATPIQFPARNVIALLPGSDPKLKKQYVAVGAHNDHIGLSRKAFDHDSMRFMTHIVRPGGAEDGQKQASADQQTEINALLADWRKTHPTRMDSIYNGADDDGSGSVSVLEIAEYMSSLKVKPKRSMLFVWHVGEEKGLWGSEWFTDHPTVPRDSIVAQLNMDMVGRGNAWDVTGASKEGAVLHGSTDYLQVIGSRRLSTELGDLVEKVNTKGKHNFKFDYSLDANGHPMNIYCRSDHYEYARYGIPIAFFTTGGHSDYHQLTDEPQYIDYPHMMRVAKMVSDAAMTLGNLDHRVVVDQAKPNPKGVCQQ